MAEDLEVGVKLVPDEEALEDVQGGEVGVGGAGGDEKVELDKERNQRLAVINRRVSRVASRIGILAGILAAITLLASTIMQIFDVSFGDVRDAIVGVINDLANKFANFIQKIPSGLAGSVLGEQTANRIQGASAGGPFGLTGALIGSILGDQGNDSPSGDGNNQNISLFTSRDSLLGDSTQQELEGQVTDEFGLVGGASGGSVPE